MIGKRPKRVLPIDHGPTTDPHEGPGRPLSETVWIEPYPDQLVAAEPTPDARYEQRESVELAFIAALQHLPARQRAALILRDVLGYSARETAEQLDTSTAAANSALQRARATMDDKLPDQSQQATLQELGDDELRGDRHALHGRVGARRRRRRRVDAHRGRGADDAADGDVVPRRGRARLPARVGVLRARLRRRGAARRARHPHHGERRSRRSPPTATTRRAAGTCRPCCRSSRCAAAGSRRSPASSRRRCSPGSGCPRRSARAPASASAWAFSGFGLCGGIVSTGGGASGHTSSTRHGAWSTTKRAGGARLCGPSRSWSPSRARTSRSQSSAAATTSRSTRPCAATSRASRPSRAAGVLEQRRGGGAGELAVGHGRVAAAAPEEPVARAAGHGLGVRAGDVEQRDLRVRGQQVRGLVDRGLPGVLDDPDERAHGQSRIPPPNHRAIVAAAMPAGTVRSPSSDELAQLDGLVGAVQHAPPQQRGQRADVGQVRPDVHADQHRQHRRRPGGGRDRHEDQRRREVVDEVGQHGGRERDEQQRGEPVALREDRRDGVREPAVARRRDDHAEAEHEDEEAGLGGAQRARRARPRGGPPRRAVRTSAPASATQTGSIPSAEPAAKPASVRPSTASTRRGSGAAARGRGRAPARTVQLAGEEAREHDPFHGEHRQRGQQHQRREARERQAARVEREQVREVRDGEQQRRRVREVRARVRVRPRRHAQPARGREHDRGEQDDRRVEAQHRRDERGDREHEREQPARAGPPRGARAAPRSPRTAPRGGSARR